MDTSSGELLGTTEAARAYSTVHQGAVYLHLGRSYEVQELDLERRRALVAPFDSGWYTQPKRETDTTIESVLDRRETLGVALSFGEVSVTETVLAYQRRRLSDHAQIDLVTLDLPQTSFSTQALWFELDPDVLDAVDALGALHAAEHAQIAVLPLIAMCDRWDIGGPLHQPPPPDRGSDDLHLRRAPRRRRAHPRGVPALRGALPRRPPPDRRVPVQQRVPLLRAVPQVRQPQRTAREGRRAAAAGGDAGPAGDRAGGGAGRAGRHVEGGVTGETGRAVKATVQPA